MCYRYHQFPSLRRTLPYSAMAADNQETFVEAAAGEDGAPLTMTKIKSSDQPPEGQTLTGKQEHC